jgi:hypothetical protein
MEAELTADEQPDGRAGLRRSLYLQVLKWTFTAFNSTRILTYLPMIWTIHANGDSSQHSLLSWLAWVGANASMAAWIYEINGRRIDLAVSMNVGNALMCAATTALICWYR